MKRYISSIAGRCRGAAESENGVIGSFWDSMFLGDPDTLVRGMDLDQDPSLFS
jgi:hypothetical protein